ncbi:MAG TPA: hypothetical protein PKU83_11415 [Chryseolinea sp.]|nr:hypothetical protein [Chryseolinea sp.]
MSIGIAIAVPDGIALAADTQTTWNNFILRAKDKKTGNEIELAEPIAVPIGWSQSARKLFSVTLAGKPYAIITAGEANLNHKTMYAIFHSATKKYSGDGTIDDIVKFFVDHLKDELCATLSVTPEKLSTSPFKLCEFILAGYEDEDVAKPVVESHLIFSGTLKVAGKTDTSGYFKKWTNRSQPNRYGGCWIGQAAYITHVVLHGNKELPPISGQFEMMTVADAVDYTRFLVAFTCDFQRFAIMVPNCGRPISSATLTPDSFEEKIVV